MEVMAKTVLHGWHIAHGAKMMPFAGFDMPIQYPTGILEEHLLTRSAAGVFDVSHMGRFVFSGRGAVAFLQYVLSSNVESLPIGLAQYALIPTPTGGAVDDAYLYRFNADEYLLVVNASNRAKDWAHFQQHLPAFADVRVTDRSEEIAMISLQGPRAGEMLSGLLDGAPLPPPRRNSLGAGRIGGVEVLIGRTGYTGEPLCFELFLPTPSADAIWQRLVDAGAAPVGLGARDTLRL